MRMSATDGERLAAKAELRETLDGHRRVWERKPVLRAIYADCYRRMVAQCRPGRTLEIGGGTGNLKAHLKDIVSLDVQASPWLDLVADAQRLPFAERSFDNIVMFDVLHHLERPRLFLQEAARTLRPGGRVVVCEPGITPVSYVFYTFFHPEPVRLGEDPLAAGGLSPDRDPWDSNQHIPTALFGRARARLPNAVPGLAVLSCDYFGLLAYPLSGGFRSWSLLPAGLVGGLLKLENLLAPVLGRLMGFRLIGVIAKQD